MSERMTQRNPNGRTYRIPLTRAGEFRVVVDKHSAALFGDPVDRLGTYEDCLTLEEALAYKKRNEKRI